MLYLLLRNFVRFGLKWYVTDWQLKNLEFADLKQPALIVSNHPNSFFDALVIAVHAPADIRFLTRGDIFDKPWANWLLRSVFMIPIYRKNQDEEVNIKNAFSIDECVKELTKGNKILIFPEGISRNKLTLQPFMHTGMRMLIERSIQMDVPLQIQPYAIGYNSFDHIPKAVSLEGMSAVDCTNYLEGPNQVNTSQLISDLRDKLEFNLPEGFIAENPINRTKNEWMRLPAKAGFYTHNWFYQIVKKQVKKKTEGTIFYDSLMFAILLFTYPVLVFLIALIFANLVGFWTGVLFFVLLPFLAYCWVNYQPVKTAETQEEERSNQLH